MNYLRPDLLRALARDHAMGTMTGGARRRFDRVLREQPQARAALAGWHAVLTPLAAEGARGAAARGGVATAGAACSPAPLRRRGVPSRRAARGGRAGWECPRGHWPVR